jgi:hypothetical protein
MSTFVSQQVKSESKRRYAITWHYLRILSFYFAVDDDNHYDLL